MDTITLIKERYGEKAVPHKRETPFGFNDLMSTYLANGVKCRAFSPNSPNGIFIVEYYETPVQHRLDFDFEKNLVSVKRHKTFPPENGESFGSFHNEEVAVYSFFKDTHTFKISHVSGVNTFLEEVRNALKTYFDVKEGFLWIEK